MEKNNLEIKQNIPLAPFTTFKIGGPAKFFAEVKNAEELSEAIEYTRKNNLKFFVLGGGSNILVSDDGFDGLVICIKDVKCEIRDTKIECGAGTLLSQAVNLAKENSLTGLEWAVGIPGTIGGAITGNAAAYGSDISSAVESVKIIDISKKEIKTVDFNNDDCNFGYRDSIFKQNNSRIILSCELVLEKGEKEDISKKMEEIRKQRNGKIPQGLSAGSFFQNPETEKKWLIERFEKEKGVACRNNKVPAGWLIEEVGFLGKKVGGVNVSENHGNFIVNLGNGTAHDIVILSSLIKQKVRVELGVQLREEIIYVGF